jgi:hypothetical protein
MARNPYRVGDAVYVPDGANYLRRKVVGTTRRTVLVAPFADSGYAVGHRWRRVRRALPPVVLTDADWAALEAEFSDSPSGGRAS